MWRPAPSGWPLRSNRRDFVPDAEGADRILVVTDGGVAVADRDRDTSTGAR